MRYFDVETGMAKNLNTARNAAIIISNGGKLNLPRAISSSFVCPFPECGVFAQHKWGGVAHLSCLLPNASSPSRKYEGPPLHCARCEVCGGESIFLNGSMIWPVETGAPPPADDMPAALLDDYNEAARIHAASPRGSAAILRLLIQKLCIELDSKEKNINDAIREFVKAGKISPQIQKALDAVRVIGNEAVHPGVMDLKDDGDTVYSLFGIVNYIVEKMISEPKHIQTIFDMLPEDKRSAIERRDADVKSSEGE